MNKRTLIDKDIEKYAEYYSENGDDYARQIIEITNTSLRYGDMLGGYQLAGLLKMLVKLSDAKVVAEIGMFTGFSTLHIATALPSDGVLFVLEMNEKYINLAKRSLENHPDYKKIKIITGNAHDTIHVLPDDIDLVFLDADKDYYIKYYNILIEKLKTGGVLVADNVFWYGGVLDENKDRKSKALHDFNEMVKSDSRVEQIMLTIRDGVMIIMKT